jgi:hypothetical protein
MGLRLSMTTLHRWTTKADAQGGRSMSFYRGMTCENVTLNLAVFRSLADSGQTITSINFAPGSRLARQGWS